jgi:glycosyltransferase involved in cell wall biosynthesis
VVSARRALLVAFHFPPLKGSSGIQRSLKFARYLPEQGWQPIVLSAHPRAYESVSDEQLAEIPPEAIVRRAFALDAARHLSIRGRYPRFAALPDRWISWVLGAVPAGRKLIKQFSPGVIWSTYPIATAHYIGYQLHRASGLPWIADFRDSMTEADYPSDPRVRSWYLKIERLAVTHASRVVFTTPGAEAMYRARYPEQPREKWVVIPNGYDEDNFASLEALRATVPDVPARLTWVHSGLLDPGDRNPSAFFDALADLRDRGVINAETLRVVLRATGHDAVHAPAIATRNLGDIVELAPPISYAKALEEMLRADALLVFQSSTCNHQIPAKIYEYMRAARPILAMTHAAGDTAATLRAVGSPYLCDLHDPRAIATAIDALLQDSRAGRAYSAPAESALRYSRRALTADLARTFTSATA